MMMIVQMASPTSNPAGGDVVEAHPPPTVAVADIFLGDEETQAE